MKREMVPSFVLGVLRTLAEAGFEAYLVGGCVRDLSMGRAPNDFDAATDAEPHEVARLFDKVIMVGARFGAVLVVDPFDAAMEVHVTTYRSESGYVDGRRPQEVRFGTSIYADLARRDFTINAVAWNPFTGEIVDPYNGRTDIEDGIIRAVGDPNERLREDALRTLRAVRFAAQFGFEIDQETWRAIEVEATGVRRLSAERVRDELLKILEAPHCAEALWIMVELGLFYEVFPELKGAGRLAQHKRGAPTLLDHLILTAASCPPDAELRLAGLLHDVGKLETRSVEESGRVTFYGHAEAGAIAARAVGQRLKLSKSAIDRIGSLIEMHMALDAQLTKKGLRRWVAKHGEAWVRDLIALGRADAAASGWEGNVPHLDAIERALEEIVSQGEAFSKSDLAVNGRDIMEALGVGPGPVVGRMLDLLYEYVLEHPDQNTKGALLAKLSALSTD